MAHKNIASSNPLEEIVVPDPTRFKAKLSRFIRDGAASLEIVSDFDQTFTRYSIGSKKVHSTGINGTQEYSIVQSSRRDCRP
mmetsp:Transcript_18708/g.33892  ORF Transcript_18708/g.33892 Transcript_18708/m.33892 type:complete len:82 (-) Transcript_18708:907-1152(-)